MKPGSLWFTRNTFVPLVQPDVIRTTDGVTVLKISPPHGAWNLHRKILKSILETIKKDNIMNIFGKRIKITQVASPIAECRDDVNWDVTQWMVKTIYNNPTIIDVSVAFRSDGKLFNKEIHRDQLTRV